MQETEQLISLYHTAFIVFLILTIVFALVSVLIFFQFRIKDVFDFKTGRGQKRTIRQMEEENAKAGKLRQEYASANTSSDLYRTPSGEIPPVIYPKTEQMDTGTEPTEQTYVPPRSSCLCRGFNLTGRQRLKGSAGSYCEGTRKQPFSEKMKEVKRQRFLAETVKLSALQKARRWFSIRICWRRQWLNRREDLRL